jgi:transcription-repair coupling factor (superfamily II helicase)
MVPLNGSDASARVLFKLRPNVVALTLRASAASFAAVERVSDIFSQVAKASAAQALLRRVESGGLLSLDGISVAAQPFLIALLGITFPQRTIIAVTAGLKAQENFHQDLTTWANVRSSKSKAQSSASSAPLFFPAWDILPHEAKLPHVDVISERLETLVALAGESKTQSKRPKFVVANLVALMQRTFPAGAIAERTRELKRGDQINPLDLVEWLEDQGYEPEAQVSGKGEIALRGGILDIFPPTCPWPVRVEFFGDEIDSIREFDPVSQLSKDSIERVMISPAGELGILKRSMADTSRPSAQQLSTLPDYLPTDALIVACEPEAVNQAATDYAVQVPTGDPFFVSWEELRQEASSRSLTWIELTENAESMAEQATETSLRLPELREGNSNHDNEGLSLQLQSLDAFRPITERAADIQVAEAQRREFFTQLHRWLRQGFAVHVFCNTDGERQRFEEIWKELVPADASQPFTHLGTLSRGFIHEEAKLVIVTDAEIFGRYKIQRPRRLKSPHAATSRSLLDIDFTEFEEGDYVVHVQHGIGRFLGLQIFDQGAGLKKTEKSRRTSGQECLAIEYAANDPAQPAPKLYVPVSEAHLVSKYVGTGKARPQLNTLGGARWAKAKAQAEVAVRDLAAEMLRIQAARESQAGHAYPADNTWQREFEGSFVYEETPDQMCAIVEAKRDMEQPKPMDRLICGDVGYGKTEVAIRAAFKAVMGGKQVAILVPTTVLAQQHFNTFRERMADYPVRVELLSRFRTARESKRVIEQLATGGVDIVIGTHRLVQSDIVFKDLGLVIIDEEQRFGVMHKEKFKMLRQLVDVLTLSATPIPRTLYLALTGARDMSTIETPPQDRLPVETIVAQYDERIIRDAIQRELNRQGQVFYLHNRVHDIEAVALRLKALVPQARLAVGHGQMPGDDLEKVMTKFVNGEADVLLSTTIIESGIDIPNANTIIIDRADRFGLSDLYQLRGRVGRYKHQAYAYLLLPRHAGLLADARKRISAIKQYSSLGSGFKIAMRDLEIRGAGNLLGSQQSGHITAVGFDLYCQLLKQSVSSLKGQKVKPRVEVQTRIDFIVNDPAEVVEEVKAEVRDQKTKPRFTVNVPRETATYSDYEDDSENERVAPPVPRTPAYLPLNYITDSRLRIEAYRKLAQTTEKRGLEELIGELRDRFGPLPLPAQMLLQVAELKILASDKDVTIIETKEDKLLLTRRGDLLTFGGRLPRMTKKDAAGRLKEIKKLLLAL